MGKICTLAIPTSIEGINTTIDVGSGCIHHAVFDSGINRNRMYDIMRNSDFSDSHIHLVTDNLQEYMSSTMDYIGMTITPHVRDIVSEFIALLYSLKSEDRKSVV